jgi:uroporphyrinogen-III synthase
MGPGSWRLRVIITRPREQAGALAERLEALGFEVVLCPLIELERVGPPEVDLDGYDWVVVTSPRGARELTERRRGELPRLAAIGPGTAAALREHGIEPSLVPRVSTQEGLVAELPAEPGRVLFAGAEDARPYLAETLRADTVVLYRTHELRPTELPQGDLVLLASASAARAFAVLDLELPAVSIGPETTREAEAQGVRVVAEAETHDLDGLVAAVAEAARVYDDLARRRPS